MGRPILGALIGRRRPECQNSAVAGGPGADVGSGGGDGESSIRKCVIDTVVINEVEIRRPANSS